MARYLLKVKIMKDNKVKDVELAGSNRLITICMTVELAIIAVAYLAEFLKGARTIGYVCMIVGLCLGLIISSQVVFRRQRDNKYTKHIVGIGFPILYAIVLFSTENVLTFTYAIPILIIASTYADTKYAIQESVGTIILNIAQAVYFFSKGIYNSSNTAMVEIHIIIVALITVFMIFSVRRVETNNHTREARVKEENEKTKALLKTNLQIGEKTNETVDSIYKVITDLGNSIRLTADAMHDVDKGATETAETVEKQLEITNEISGRVGAVSSSYKNITSSIQDTILALNAGKRNVDGLINLANTTKNDGAEVSDKIQKLNEFMEKMSSVIDIISDITSQTSLLSLNASIEAARAGEAGKGFAVVASEIQSMANSTQSAADEIKTMLDNVNQAIDNVVEVTNVMLESINKQEETIRITADNFEAIEGNTDSIKTSSDELSDAISELEKSNVQIVNSISTISAITEEVSAHANNTVTSCEDNIATVDSVSELAKELRELAGKLTEK